MTDNTNTNKIVDQAVAEGGAYEVLRKRLADQGKKLSTIAEELNANRLAEFGDNKMEVVGRARIRTENNAVGRDIVQVGGMLLFGYNVFLGLKGTTSVKDVFGLYRLVETSDSYDVTPVDLKNTFLDDPVFLRDFSELYSYYKDSKLIQLLVRDSKLLAVFQISSKITDIKVFRWNITSSGEIFYMDMRGDRDVSPPPPYDFEWVKASKNNEVSGRFPHLNILDTIFVETTGGDLTVKIENNTEVGYGIYSEPVKDKNQSLDDAQVEYAKVGSLILLRVLPFREHEWRGLIYNTITQKVVRMDAINQACVQLPEDHGIIFPGGYYLQNGEHKKFDATMNNMAFKRSVISPNGEDVAFIFYEPNTGTSALLVYNMVRRSLQAPIMAHGYARLGDGRMVLFQAENDDPTRIHQLQVWNTPFFSDEYADSIPPSSTELGRIGNANLVRAISDFFDLTRSIESDEVSSQRYELLTTATRRLFDAHYWIENGPVEGLGGLLHEIAETAESVLDEFEKVQQIRRHSEQSLSEVKVKHRDLLGRMVPESWSNTQEFVDALNEIVALRGRLLSIREYRYIDVDAIDAMSVELSEAHENVGAATGKFLSDPKALAPLDKKLTDLDNEAQKAETASKLAELVNSLDSMSADLDMLSELMASLKVDDATQRTKVVEALSNLYSRLNQAKARANQRKKSLGSSEAIAQFGAQFTLFGQSVASALSMANTPEKADEQLARLLVQLEELESQFGEFDQFLGDIFNKREELLETFETHKQTLLDDRQRKAQSIADAAQRILDGLGRRAERFKTPDELNSFFVGDALIQKIRDLVSRLKELKDTVRADEIEAKVKAARDQAIRALRDRSDLFEDGGNVIKLGPRHKFSVNNQPLDLTLLPREDHLALHLTGTNFMEPLVNSELDKYRSYWLVALESESENISRAEYLAIQVFKAAQSGEEGLSIEKLNSEATNIDNLGKIVRDFAASRYRDGYEKGIHDHDATLILSKVVMLYQGAGNLIYSPNARALALDFWHYKDEKEKLGWISQILTAKLLSDLGNKKVLSELHHKIERAIIEDLEAYNRTFEFDASANTAALYLIDVLHHEVPKFDISSGAERLSSSLANALEGKDNFQKALKHLSDNRDASLTLIRQAVEALITREDLADLSRFVNEAAAVYLYSELEYNTRHAELSYDVKGLLSQHDRIVEGNLRVSIDDILARYEYHVSNFLPEYRHYQEVRHEVLDKTRKSMRLDEFRARPLTSFVRNQLINQVYLPVIGDNLAKQMGTVGENKRSDLMGLLMMISPPGYGKTTLMEYVASRLGLVFMKINGPSLGHSVKSLDPAQAPDATSRQELEKVNLALEMGNNVMLYVDDIQHTHPEFLQKFISLCDGTRRIEGVWKGETKTYDMRGKKFAVVMSGNPYTESGEVFKIPDMLANRADIYNLGDVLGGMEDVFLMSYIENSLTSNPVLAPMATRDMADLYLLMDRALGKDVSTNNLKHSYSGAEINEIVAVLERLIKVREIVYKVNKQYIASAAQDDQYRTEPPFKLQGSYRNMNKLAEKISPAMNMDEIQQIISDHYLGESQLLTTGAEENLLKLAEIRGTLTEEQQKRWTQIKDDFRRTKRMGGSDSDVGTRVVSQLGDISDALKVLEKLAQKDDNADKDQNKVDPLEKIQTAINELALTVASREEIASSISPLEARKSSGLSAEELSVVIERHMDTLVSAISELGRNMPNISVAPQTYSAPSFAQEERPSKRSINPEKVLERSDAAKTSDLEIPVATQPKKVEKAPVPSSDEISNFKVAPIPTEYSDHIPPSVVENMVLALGAHQQPLLHALRDRLEDQALLGRALALLLERLANSQDLFVTANGENRKSEFEKVLNELRFRYVKK